MVKLEWNLKNYPKCVSREAAKRAGRWSSCPQTGRTAIPKHCAESVCSTPPRTTDSTDPYVTPSLASRESGGKSGSSERFIRIMVKAGVDPLEITGQGKRKFRQLLYWIEHSKEVLADEFKCFSLQNGNSVIGYLQYSFSEEKIIFL